VNDDEPADPSGLEGRMTSFEQRLERLESRLAEGSPSSVPARAGLDEPFWALEGLKARAGTGGAVLFTGAVALPTGERYDWQQGFDAQPMIEADWSSEHSALSALGNVVRLLLLREVLRGARTVAELGEHQSLGTAGQLYHHLRQLVAAGWLQTPARGRYSVPAERVVPLLVILAAARR
jgi:hypothetical protein